MRANRLVAFLFLLTPSIYIGQKQLILYSKNSSTKSKHLNIGGQYCIKTTDTIYKTEISGITDSGLKILCAKTTQDSIMIIKKHTNPRANDTSYYRTKQIDTIIVAFRDIVYLEKDLLKKRNWLDPVFWTLVGGSIGVLSAHAISHETNYDINDVVGFVSGFGLITLPLLYVSTRTIKYDMLNKWTFTK